MHRSFAQAMHEVPSTTTVNLPWALPCVSHIRPLSRFLLNQLEPLSRYFGGGQNYLGSFPDGFNKAIAMPLNALEIYLTKSRKIIVQGNGNQPSSSAAVATF